MPEINRRDGGVVAPEPTLVLAQPLSLTSSGPVILSARSSSTTHHIVEIKVDATSGTGAAMSVSSENRSFSCTEFTGHETAKGTLKISHVNASGTETGDNGAAALSIDLQPGSETNTACQGIFLTCTLSEATGAWLTIRNEAKALLYRIKATGLTEQKELGSAPGTIEGWALYVEGGVLKLKIGAAAAKVVTVT